jgi:hypothetical protein
MEKKEVGRVKRRKEERRSEKRKSQKKKIKVRNKRKNATPYPGGNVSKWIFPKKNT